MRPATNYASTFDDLQIFEDVHKRSVFYVPALMSSQLGEQEIGNVKHILQGTIEIGISELKKAALVAQFPKSVVAPIEISGYQFKDPFASGVPGHSVRIHVLSQIPYPKLILSATLDKGAADYLPVLERLRNSWADKSILKGALAIEAPADRILLKYTIGINNNEIKQIREEELEQKGLTEIALCAFIKSLIDRGAIEGAVEFGGSTGERIRDELSTKKLLSGHFLPEDQPTTMDDGTAITLWQQYQHRIGAPTENYLGVKTTPETINIVLN